MVTFSRYISIAPHRRWLGEFLAEFLGTFLLVFLGNNAVAESVLTYGKGGNSVTVYLGYGMGLFLGILVSVGISGAHLNPAVTVAGAVVKKFDSSKIFHYLLGQYLGGFVAASATYFVYIDSIEAYHDLHGVNKSTATIFHTFPKENLSVVGSFADQILGTMVLVIAIYAITDKFNAKIPPHLAPFYITLALIGIGCSLGVNQGYACNPARDLAPRIFTYLTDWGSDVFSAKTYWYVPIIGPHIGAVLGAFVYGVLIEKFEIRKEDEIFNRDNKINYKADGNPFDNVNQSTEPKYKEEYRATYHL